MWILIPIFILLLSTLLILKCYILPKRSFNKYLSILQGLGYKVHAIPFRPMRATYFDMERESLKRYNDSCYMGKQIAPSFDIILTNTANSILLVFTSPDLIKDFFTMEKPEVFQKTRVSTLGLRKIIDKGLLLSEGNEWRKKRKILSRVFNFDLVRANIAQIAKICDSDLYKFQRNCKISDNQYCTAGIALTANIANRIMLKCFFGEEDYKDQIKGRPISTVIIDMVEESMKVSFSPVTLLLGNKAFEWNLTKDIREYKQTIRIFNSVCQSIVERKTKEIEEGIAKNPKKDDCKDLLQALLREKKRCQLEGEEFVYNDNDIIQEFATFIVAGTDTTSNFVVLMLCYIFRNPNIQERLRKEINEHIKTQEDYTFEKLKNLTYLQCVQKETNRHYGPVTILLPRKPTQDSIIGNIPIFKGTGVTVSLFGCHFNPKFYKDPHAFRPERWENECDNLHPYAFVPFSAGPRTCIGKQLANLESKIIIVKLLKRYQKIVLPKDIKLVNGFIYFASMEKIKFYK